MDARAVWLAHVSAGGLTKKLLLLPVGRTKTSEALIGFRLYGHVQSAVIFVAQGDKAEGLQNASLGRPHWIQHFGHAVHISRLRLKCHFDEIAFAQRLIQMQHAAGG